MSGSGAGDATADGTAIEQVENPTTAREAAPRSRCAGSRRYRERTTPPVASPGAIIAPITCTSLTVEPTAALLSKAWTRQNVAA